MILIILSCIIVVMAIVNSVKIFKNDSLRLYRGQGLMWIIVSSIILALTIQAELQVWP